MEHLGTESSPPFKKEPADHDGHSTEKLELLDATIIRGSLSHPLTEQQLLIFDTIDSTNTYLTKLLQSSHPPTNLPLVCLAERQTAGRGRLGKKWISPYAKNIYLSLAQQFVTATPQLLGTLSLAIAVAVVDALKRYGITQTLSLKWPNDIWWNNRKLAGVLIEFAQQKPSHYGVVIGIGLNLQMPSDAATHISQPWCDLTELEGTTPQRNRLISLLIDQLLDALTLYQQRGLVNFIEKWRALDLSYRRQITVITPTAQFHGQGMGIDDQGRLLLQDDSGLHVFSSGQLLLTPHP